jgi:hypothetical protein
VAKMKNEQWGKDVEKCKDNDCHNCGYLKSAEI